MESAFKRHAGSRRTVGDPRSRAERKKIGAPPAVILMSAGKRDRASPLMRREPAWRLNALSKESELLMQFGPGLEGGVDGVADFA